jgi:uncharacterized peroxidase-related enzyme
MLPRQQNSNATATEENRMTELAFTDHTVDTAGPAGPALARAQAQFGFVPGALARMASSPGLVEAFTTVHAIFERQAKLTPLEREVVVMAVSVYNACHTCVALHTGLLRRLRAESAMIAALREGRDLADPRLQALRLFVERVLATRGAVGEPALAAFLAAGYDHQQALDVVLAIGTFTLTTYAKRLTDVPLDPACEPFRWTEAG